MRRLPTAVLAVVLALTALAAVVPTAHAAVRIGPSRVVVATKGARAVIERAPFRIAFDRGAGRPVLRQVANRRIDPVRLPLTQDPEPFSLERERDNAVYSPLTFEVGREQRAQWTGVYWAGDLLFSRRSGTVYSALEVIRARRTGRGAALVLSTNDPSGRVLFVSVAPDRGRAIRVRAAPSSPEGVMAMADSFASSRREAFRGFGGRH